MYEQFYGLKEKPFNLTPDPEFLYMADQHKLALEQVLYGIRRREGFTVLVGDVGTGKTTLCWALLAKLECNFRSALVLNPLLNEEDMLRAIIQDFGVEPRLGGGRSRRKAADGSYDASWMNGRSRKELADELNAFLLEGAEKDEFSVVIIDESQDLSVDVLEQLRLLSNLETAKKKLLQIIFVGQSEFERKLKHPQLRSLNQRISIRHRIQPLSRVDVEHYVEHRLKVAGASPRLAFTPAAYREIYRYSKGYPRLVNLICDRSLLASSGEREFRVEARFVKEAAKNLRGSGSFGMTSLPLRKIAVATSSALMLATLAIFVFSWARDTLRLGFDKAGLTAVHAAAAPEPKHVAPPPVRPKTRAVAPVRGRVTTPTVRPETLSAAPKSSADFPKRFKVQVYSAASEEDAIAAVKSLQQRGYTAFSRLMGNWHAVYVGPFDSYTAAKECQLGLQKDTSDRLLVLRSVEPVAETEQEDVTPPPARPETSTENAPSATPPPQPPPTPEPPLVLEP